ncbi:hypothetical protein Tco_0167034 [Tanacetum coccineum]
MGVRVGRGGRGRRLREGNDESVDDLNGQGNGQGMGANGGIEEVNRNAEGANRGVICEADIQGKEQKESQKQTNPSTEWKGQSQKSSN